MNSANNNYNKKLKPFSRALRNHSTKSEIRLWCELLRNKQMLGFYFWRQRAIDNYIVDFFCKELNLVIELDGLTHTWAEVVEKDKAKQNKLELLGYTVLRFNDEEVMLRIDNVARTIENWIREKHSDKIKLPFSEGIKRKIIPRNNFTFGTPPIEGGQGLPGARMLSAGVTVY